MAGGDAGADAFATCDGVPNTDLRVSASHCGRCDHACGDAGCSEGQCIPVTLDPAKSAIVTGDATSFTYLRVSYDLERYSPGAPPTTITNVLVDGGDDGFPSFAIRGSTLWYGSRTRLYSAAKAPSVPVLPDLGITLDFDGVSTIVPMGGELWITEPTHGGGTPDDGTILRYDIGAGAITGPLVPQAPGASDALLTPGGSFVWLEVDATGTRLRVRDSDGNITMPYSAQAVLIGVVLDGTDV